MKHNNSAKQKETPKDLGILDNKAFQILISLCLIICLVQCGKKNIRPKSKTTKNSNYAVSFTNVADVSQAIAPKVLDKIKKDVADYQFQIDKVRNFIVKGQIEIKTKQGQRMSFKIQVKGDSKNRTLMRIFAYGFEVAKAYMDEDSLFVYSKFEGKLYYGSVNAGSSSITQIFSDINNVWLTRSLINYSEPVKVVQYSDNLDTLQFYALDGSKGIFDFWVKNDQGTYQLRHSKLQVASSVPIKAFANRNIGLFMDYKYLSALQVSNFTYFSQVHMFTPEEIDIIINIKNIDINNEDFQIQHTFSKKLERVSIDDLLKNIG